MLNGCHGVPMAALTDRDARHAGEQTEFRDTLRRFLVAEAPSAKVRAALETEAGFDPDLWKTIAQDLGLPGTAISPEHGGQGFGLGETALICEELGRALAPTPYFGSAVLAAGALSHAPTSPESSALLAAIAAGETACLAWSEPGLAYGESRFATTLDAGAVSGTKTLVLDGHVATHLLVAATAPDGRAALVAVDPAASGVTRERVDSVDRTRRLATIGLDRAPCQLLDRDAGPNLERTLRDAAIALSADSIGGFAAIMEMGVDYAREREQFGRAIGSFQAVKHRLADSWILFEASRAATDEAIAAAVEDRAEADLLASIARAYVGDAYTRAAFENIQVHGGIGVTWEFDAHLFSRRAQFNAAYLGSVAHHREQIVRAMEGGA